MSEQDINIGNTAETTSTGPQTYDAAPLRGINISGAEAGSTLDYAYQGMPTMEDAEYYVETRNEHHPLSDKMVLYHR